MIFFDGCYLVVVRKDLLLDIKFIYFFNKKSFKLFLKLCKIRRLFGIMEDDFFLMGRWE